MPLHLGHDAAGLVPALGLVAEAGVAVSYMIRRTANRSREQVRDVFPQHSIGGKADRIQEALSLQELVHRRRGEGGIGTKVAPQLPFSVSFNDRLQHLAPAMGAMHVAGTQGAPFKIAELVEAEQRMVTGAAEMAVVGGSFLSAMGRADAAVHVEDDRLRRSCTRSIQTPDRAVNAARLSSVARHSVSNLPIWLVEAAIRSRPLRSTMARMTGSCDRRWASFTFS